MIDILFYREAQIAVPSALVLVVSDKLHRAFTVNRVVGCNVVEPCLFLGGVVVVHDDNVAAAVCIQHGSFGVARVLVRDRGCADGKCGLGGQNTRLACVVVVGEVVIPVSERTMLDVVIRQIVLAGVNGIGFSRAECGGLGLIAVFQRYRTGLRG